MADELPENLQRWTGKHWAALILSVLEGETSTQRAARKHGLRVAEVEEWKERYLLAAENTLRARPRDEEALKEECVWQHAFAAFSQSRGAIGLRIEW